MAFIKIELGEVLSICYGRDCVEKFHVADTSAFYSDRTNDSGGGEFVVVAGPMKIAGTKAGTLPRPMSAAAMNLLKKDVSDLYGIVLSFRF